MNRSFERESQCADSYIYRKAQGKKSPRGVTYFEHLKRLNTDMSSPDGENRQVVDVKLGEKEQQLEGRSAFCLQDISNTQDVARAHRRISSKLLAFDDALGMYPATLPPLISIYPRVEEVRVQIPSKEASMALISEFPSSFTEENERVRTNTKGSTILSELSSDSSVVKDNAEIAYVSATTAPMEIDLYDAGETAKDTTEKVKCPSCGSVTVPILSYSEVTDPWYVRLFSIPRLTHCCQDWTPATQRVDLTCRKCGGGLERE